MVQNSKPKNAFFARDRSLKTMARRSAIFLSGSLIIAYALLTGCSTDPATVSKSNSTNTPSSARQTRISSEDKVLTGAAARGDWTTDAPGVRRKLTATDLPAPNETKSARNHPRLVEQPKDAMPQVPSGFRVQKFAEKLSNPRQLRVAPNGDLFVAESKANRISVLRDADGDGQPEVNQVFVDGLTQPFGIAFYPPGATPKFVYVANTDSVVRFPYNNGDVKVMGGKEVIITNIASGGQLPGGGHWTRDIVFSKDGTKLFLSVGSKSNNSDNSAEERRARIFVYNPEGQEERVYASGIRNPVGLAINPKTGELWTSVNERDELGDDLVPDYITRVTEDGFYGWPWYYIGGNQDPAHKGKHPELRNKVIVPDILIQSHSASLGMTFYAGSQFPPQYRDGAFAAEHGSWNRERRTGYKLIYLPMRNGRATGEYMDFMTGFVTPDGNVWGRPVGVAVDKDGALFVTDDGGNVIWRITYQGK